MKSAPRLSAHRVAFLVAIVGLVLAAGPTGAVDLPGGGQQQEYFVRQQAGEDVLIRIDGVEASFEAAVYTIEGERLIASGIPGSRVAPLFQYVLGTDRDRQLDIRVTAPLDTNRTRFDLGLSRITVRDDRSSRLAQAYEWLSFGLELPAADTAANWSIKVNALINAARTFQGFGMEALQLWSLYYVGQLTLVELGDNNTALQVADDLLAAPGTRRQPVIQLAATRLRAEALAALRGGGEPLPGDVSEVVQEAADATAALAASLGFQYERAEAENLAGLDLAAQARFGEALSRFQAALDIAVAIEADDLATRIRESMVDIHGVQGDVAATSEVLQAIEEQLTEDGANDELAQNLLAQGRIYNRTYRYSAAREVLRQALAFEHNSATRSQVRLALAEAAWALGDLDEAWAQARAAVVDPASGAWRRPTTVLDVAQGIGILAGVHRARGEWSAMTDARNAQERVLEGRTARNHWQLDRAMDALARDRTTEAVTHFRTLRSSGDELLGALAQLWLCRLGGDCPPGAEDRAHRALKASAIPRYRVAADWLLGASRARSGRSSEAVALLDDAVGEMTFLRYSVPGVLGAAYWQWMPRLAGDALAAWRATGEADRLLLGLARLRWLRASGLPTGLPFDRAVAGLDTDAFRALLARRQDPEPGDDPARLARDILGALDTGRSAFRQATAFLTIEGLTTWLRALEEGEAVLDVDYFSDRASALMGTRTGVTRVDLGSSSALADWPSMLEGPDVSGDEWMQRAGRLGARLLAPLDGRLPRRVYLADGEALAFLPWEALLPDARQGGNGRAWVRLAGFPSRPGPGARLGPLAPARVFVAGRPTDYRSGYLDRLDAGAELRAAMDPFVGPGLQVIQGAALLPDEFTTEAFESADLVHLATPARLRLDAPALSRLELSEERRGEGRIELGPVDLAGWRLRAGLVVFSQAGASAPAPGFQGPGRPPLVAEALGAGSDALLVSAWPGEDAVTAGFLERFYGRVLAGDDLVRALESARSGRSGAGGAAARDAARYQLWLE